MLCIEKECKNRGVCEGGLKDGRKQTRKVMKYERCYDMKQKMDTFPGRRKSSNGEKRHKEGK